MASSIGLALVTETASRPLAILVLLVVLSLVPFLLLMLTSFVKIAIVISILRSAIGAAQVPPGQVVTGLSLLLTLFVMAPTGEKVWNEVQPLWSQPSNADLLSPGGLAVVGSAFAAAREPLRAFLQRHASGRDRDMFLQLARRQRTPEDAATVTPHDLLVLAPAFVVSELRRGFEIGILIFVPFLVIDLVIASLLATLGLQMLSPALISLPLKLLLFVLADGWHIILRGLVASYV
jgi:type III secretion protein R